MSWFQELRRNRNITFPSIYMSALVTVLSYFREIDEGSDEDMLDKDFC